VLGLEIRVGIKKPSAQKHPKTPIKPNLKNPVFSNPVKD